MNEFLATIGIHYLQLQYLVADHGHKVTKAKPFQVALVRRKGKLSLRYIVGKAVSYVEMPEDFEFARKMAQSSLELLIEKVTHVSYEELVQEPELVQEIDDDDTV